MTQVDKFKSAIIRIRDILRSPSVSITGMDSMRHICLYLLGRYMTKDKVEQFRIPEQFAWETLCELTDQNGGMQKSLDLFCHDESDCLVRYFDMLFDTNKFPFDIRDADKHREIIKILQGVDLQTVDLKIDILGWVYEQHLKTGSSAARDLGQFFTDRDICKYMTALCSPKIKDSGEPESVCDPSMGTGGFLTSYVSWFKVNNLSVDWTMWQSNIHGCDADAKVSCVAKLNLFMETGGSRATNLRTHDSLYGGLLQQTYDIILANMPFGLKGIKHASCCDSVKNLKIRGTKSEPLFLQLMMASLAPKGRCAVIVPDGMLTIMSTCHIKTREHLLSHFELRGVIRLKGQFFMNTSIQPSILLFENTGDATTYVDFWDVMRTDSGDVAELDRIRVPRSSISDGCSLDVRKYKIVDVTNKLGHQHQMIPFCELAEVSFGERITKGKHSGTLYPVYGGGDHSFRTDRFNRDGTHWKIARFAVSQTTMVMRINGPFWLLDSGFTIKSKVPDKMTTDFLGYCLLMDKVRLSETSTGSCQKNVNMGDLSAIKYPCPSLETQCKITAILDSIFAFYNNFSDQFNKIENITMDQLLDALEFGTIDHVFGRSEIQARVTAFVDNAQKLMSVFDQFKSV